MSTCRTCARAARVRPVIPAPGAATLVVRLWPEPGGPRARLLGVRDPGAEPETFGVVQGVDDIVDAVRRWVLTVGERVGQRTGEQGGEGTGSA